MKATHTPASALPGKANLLLLVIAVLAVIILGACSAPQSAPTAEAVEPTEAAEPVEPTALGSEATAEPAQPVEPAPAGGVSFSKDIAPIMERSCLTCHGGERVSRGFSVKSYEEIMAGSINGAMVVAGDPAASKFFTLIERGTMPKRGEKLSAEEIQMISDWIAAGAPNN